MKDEEDKGESHTYLTDSQIDTDMTLLFPDEYIENNSERLRLYRILDSIPSEERLQLFEKELEDRFGPVPPQTAELLNVVRLRWIAVKLGFEKIILKQNRMIIHFISNPESAYFESSTFRAVLGFVQSQGRKYTLTETEGKLRLSTKSINSISTAIGELDRILKMF